MFYKQFLLILASLLMASALVNSAKVQANSCEEVIAGHGLEISVTDGLWAFIEELLQRQDLRLAHLERMLDELKENRLANIYSPQEIQVNSTKLVYSQTAAEYFASSQLDLKKLKYRLEQKIAKLNQNQNERTIVKEQTASPYRKIKFVELGVPGKFIMGGVDNPKHLTEINYPVAFSDTHVTQNQWISEMKQNPAWFKGKESIDGIIQQPDHPVEQITWYAAAWYTNQISKKLNLPETYNFKNFIAKPGTNAADGSLKPAGDSGEVYINAPSIYEAKGIRLATEAELEWLALAPQNDQKMTQTQYPWGDDESKIAEYCWYDLNSNHQTHEVGGKKLYNIRGQIVFDLAGNVKSWSNDRIESLSDAYFEPLNPVGPQVGSRRVLRGGAFRHLAHYQRSALRYFVLPDCRDLDGGLRLARTCF